MQSCSCTCQETPLRSTRRSRPQFAQQTCFQLTKKQQSYLQDIYVSVCANKPSADRLGSFQTGSNSLGKSLFCRSCTIGGATDMQMNPFPSNPDACVCTWMIKTPSRPFSDITMLELEKKKTTATMNYFAHQRETGQFQRCF